MINQKQPECILFKNGELYDFTKVMHVQCHRELFNLVKTIDKEKLHLSDELLKRWEKNIDVEVELNKDILRSEHTAKLAELDDKRDNLIVALLGMVRLQVDSPIAASQAAAKKINLYFKGYQGIQSESYEAESGHVAGLLKDAKKLTTELATLGLTNIVNELETIESEFESLLAERRDDKVTVDLPKVAEARRNSDDTLFIIYRNIEARYVYATSDADRAIILKLQKGIEQIFAEFETTRKINLAAQRKNKQADTEKMREKLAPMFAAFEEAKGLEAGSVSFTGRTKTIGRNKHYELSVQGTEQTLWVVKKGDHLEEVKTEDAAKPAKPKKPKKTEPKPTGDLTAHGSASDVKPGGSATETPAPGTPAGSGGME